MTKIDLNKIVGEEAKQLSRIEYSTILAMLKAKGYIIDDQNKKVTQIVLKYFLGHEDFLESDIVKSENSFNKGLLIFGDYGIGKTFLFEALHDIGRKLVIERGIQDLWFNKISAGSFVDNYMEEVQKRNEQRTWYIKDYYKGKLYIDDLGFEKLAFNNTELFAELLFERNKNKVKTFVTTNLKPSDITKRYGMRIGDRLPEMFNIINWQGKSYRK